jgi:hypothetical protein
MGPVVSAGPDSDFLSHHLTAGRGSALPRPDTSIRSGLGHGRDLTQEPVATPRQTVSHRGQGPHPANALYS